MEKPLKQRLTGALVLIALLSLVLPLFFNEPPADKPEAFEVIPPVPAFQPIVVNEPKPVENLDRPVPLEQMYQMQSGSDQATAQSDKSQSGEPLSDAEKSPPVASLPAAKTAGVAVKPAPVEIPKPVVGDIRRQDKPALQESGLPESWVVQVISYSDQDKAEKLKKELQVQGYPAFTRTATINGKKLTRVFIGPKLQKRKAEQIKQVIDRQYRVDSLVVLFKPL